MNLIDTHSHLQFDAFSDDREKIIEQAAENELGILVVGCDYESSKKALEMVKGKECMWAAVGQHPTDTALPFEPKAFQELCKNEKVVALGECGLDYYRIPKDVDQQAWKLRQKELLKQHIDLVHEIKKPMIIHCRDAHEDMVEILLASFGHNAIHQNSSKEHGVLHCFTGNVAQAQSYLDLHFLISFTGIITFTDQYDDVVRHVPLEKMLIETDSPFLAPEPYRGKKNCPLYVKQVAEQIAKIKSVSFEEVARVTTENAKRLFKLPNHA